MHANHALRRASCVVRALVVACVAPHPAQPGRARGQRLQRGGRRAASLPGRCPCAQGTRAVTSPGSREALRLARGRPARAPIRLSSVSCLATAAARAVHARPGPSRAGAEAAVARSADEAAQAAAHQRSLAATTICPAERARGGRAARRARRLRPALRGATLPGACETRSRPPGRAAAAAAHGARARAAAGDEGRGQTSRAHP